MGQLGRYVKKPTIPSGFTYHVDEPHRSRWTDSLGVLYQDHTSRYNVFVENHTNVRGPSQIRKLGAIELRPVHSGEVCWAFNGVNPFDQKTNRIYAEAFLSLGDRPRSLKGSSAP
jgi:hypothetical protein